jgi:tetratricopeptide (TPR) repeat protein
MKIRNSNIYKVLACCFITNFILLLNSSVIFGAAPVDSIIAQGNKYYMQRHYSLAERSYAQVLARGYESYELYYNMGNAYYKQDRIAEAILYYEKALLLKPGDEDIHQNLALANNRIIDKIDNIPDFFLIRWMLFFQRLMNPDQWAVLSLVLFILAMAGFVLFVAGRSIALRKAGFISGCSLIIVSVIALFLMFGRMHRIEQHDHAIIMEPIVNARSSPDEQSTNVFVLHAGTKVALMDSVQNWKEIRIANGNKGWVPGKSIKGI